MPPPRENRKVRGVEGVEIWTGQFGNWILRCKPLEDCMLRTKIRREARHFAFGNSRFPSSFRRLQSCFRRLQSSFRGFPSSFPQLQSCFRQPQSSFRGFPSSFPQLQSCFRRLQSSFRGFPSSFPRLQCSSRQMQSSFWRAVLLSVNAVLLLRDSHRLGRHSKGGSRSVSPRCRATDQTWDG
jgi:hypothetical protein